MSGWKFGSRRPSRSSLVNLCSGLRTGARRGCVWVLSLSLVLQPVILSAQTVPDPGIPSATPSMEVAPNGVPVVNIVAPSARGVSHNRFLELNIDPEGLIFNNSKTFGTSRLGGVILANPNLNSGSTARIILNEVTGANSSQLRGFAEVFGDRAQFVLANPNGITCNGCGFINTGRTTLATGLPRLHDGALVEVDVDGSGVLSIEGTGLNAEDAEALDLLARTIRVQAPVNAQDLQVFAGRNLLDYGARMVTVKADDGSEKPALAIDGSHFGAMYANQISIIATEDGVGVRLPDDMATGNGDFTITAAGKIELTNASAAGRMEVTSSGGDIEVGGTVNSQGNLTVAGVNVTNDGSLVAGLDSDGTLWSAATLDVSAEQSLTNNGQLLASSEITLTSTTGTITNSAAADITSQGSLSAIAGQNIDNAGGVSSSGAATLTATRIDNQNGLVTAGGALSLTADTIENQNTSDTDEGLKSETTITLTTDTLTNTDGNIVSKGATVVTGKTAGQTLTLTAGKVVSGDRFEVTADAIESSADIEARTSITAIAATGNLNQSGTWQAGAGVTLTATNGALTNGGRVKAVEDIVVSAASLENTATGVLESGGDISITAPTQTTNAGIVSAQGDLTIQTDILENDQGALLAVGKMILDGIGDSQATRIANRSGVIETLNGDITIDAAEFINERKGFSVSNQQTYSQWESTVVPVSSVVPGVSTQHLEWNASGTLYFTHPDDPEWHIYYDYGPLLVRQYTDVVTGTSPAAYLSSGGALTLSADTIQNKYSHVSSAGDMTLTGSTLDNIGQLLTKRTTVYKSGGYYNRCQSNKGAPCLGFNGAGSGAFAAVVIDSAEGTIQAGGQLTGDFTNQIDNLTILGSVSQGDLIQANTVAADTKEAPPLAELADVSLVDFFQQLPAKDALTQLAPASSNAVFETRVAFANPSIVLGSEYFLSRVKLDTNDIPDRFAFSQALEERLVQNAVRLKTGRRWLDPLIQDASLQLKQLIDSGIAAQESLQLTVGVHLSRDQISRLNQSIIWYVEETINGERVLAPRLYLAATDAIAFGPNGASIVAASVDLASTRIDNSGDITATDGAVELTAGEDIAVRSGRVTASGDVRLRAGGALSVVTDTTQVRTANRGMQTLVGRKAWIDAGGRLTLEADESVVIQGADIRADEDVDISAGDVLVVGSVAVDQRVNFDDGETYDRSTQTTNRGSTIEAGGDVETVSGSDTIIQGSTVRAGGDVDVTALGGVATLSARNVTDSQMQRGGGKKSGTSRTVDNIRTQVLAGGNVRITALTGDIISQATKFQAEGRQPDSPADDAAGTVTLDAEQGQVALLSATDESSWTYQSSSSNVFFYKSRDAGAVDTNVIMTEVDAQGGLIIRAAPWSVDESGAATGGVRVEIRDAGSLEANIATLAEVPGLEYLADLQARDDVDWQTVREIHDSWDYKAQGLSGVAAAVIAIAVTVATKGWGAKLFFSQAAINAGGSMVAAANAGFSMLAANASVSLINNRGDLGAVLKDLASSQSLRSLATAMVTAGLTNGLLPEHLTGPFAKLELGAQIQRVAIEQSVSAAAQTVINGQPIDDTLKYALISSATQIIGANVASRIGEAFEGSQGINKVGKYIAHATLGCGIGAAYGGSCAAGAAGSVIGEVVGEIYFSKERQEAFGEEVTATIADPSLTKKQAFARVREWQQQGVDIGRLAASVAVAVAGGDEADVNAAAKTSANAIENNICGFGLCVAAAFFLINAVYAILEGEGDIITGVDKIIADEDTLNRVVQDAAAQGVELAYAVSPEATEAALEYLAALSDAAGDIIFWVDDATGQVFSGNWNNLDSETQQNIKRSGFFLTAAAGAAATGITTAAVAAKVSSKITKIVDPNKLRHIFGQSKHKLDDVVKEFGSERKAFEALQGAVEQDVRNKGITGLFEETVKIGTHQVTVRGNVVDGIVTIGTAFKPIP